MLSQSVTRARIGLKAGKPAMLRYMIADPTATMLEPLALATLSRSLPVIGFSQGQNVVQRKFYTLLRLRRLTDPCHIRRRCLRRIVTYFQWGR